MDSQQFKSAAYAAVDHSKHQVTEYYDTVGSRRVISAVQPGYLKKLLPPGPPQEGETWEDIQKDIDAKIIPGLTHWASPGFMAFYPCNSSFPAMLGEMYSAAFNCPAFNWACSPAVTELETIVLDWMATLFGLPDCYKSNSEGGGVIQGTASEAILTVMVAARDRYLRQATAHISDDKERDEAFYTRRVKLVALSSELAHSATQKATQIAGVRFRAVPAPAEHQYAMKGPIFREAIEQCLRDGLEPFYTTVTLGTTTTCATDDFEGIAAVLKEHPLIWTHVDAAYAGAALVCPEYQHHTAHFAAFNSFDTNMHKWLLTNFDASCLYVKRRRDLIDTFSITPSYLRNRQSDGGLVTDYRDWQIPLGRRFRSLKIWFVLRTYGVKGIQAYIRNHIQLGEKFGTWVASRPDLFTIIGGPTFALTVLAINPPKVEGVNGTPTFKNTDTESNVLSQEACETINEAGEIMLTSCVIGGKYAIRVVSANPKTDEAHLRRAFEILVETAEKVRSKRALNLVNGHT